MQLLILNVAVLLVAASSTNAALGLLKPAHPKFPSYSGMINGEFGAAVAMSGDGETTVVSTPHFDFEPAALTVYKKNKANQWVFHQNFSGTDLGLNSNFG